MKRIHKVLSLLLAGGMSLMAVSCGGSGGKAGKVKIRFSTWDNAESLQFQQKMVDKFNEQSETIEVSLESYGDNYDTKITASMGGKDAPDVMYMWNYPKYGEALQPLDEYIASEGEAYKANFYETLWNYNKIGDDILGIPVGYTTHVLYYNKDLFDAAGVGYPTDTWTWDDLRAAAEKISNPEKKIFGLAIPIQPDPFDYEMFAWSNGSAYCDSKGNPAGFLNSAETAEAFAVMQDLIKDGLAVPTDDSGVNNFKMGTVAMFINGAWSLNGLREANMNFSVALLPNYGNQSSQSIVSSSGVTISKHSEHKDEAWEFVKFWTSEELNKERIGYELPVLKSVVASEKLGEDEIDSKFYAMLERSAEHMPASFLVAEWSALSEKINLALEQILNPNEAMAPQQALDIAAK